MTQDFPPAEILSALPSAVFLLNAHNRFLYLNPAAESLFSSSEKILKGKKIEEVMAESSTLPALINRVRHQQRKLTEGCMSFLCRKGEGQRVNLEITPASDGAVLVCMHPLSQPARFPDFFENESASAMSSILAHEIRNPLSGIRGAAQILESEASSPEAASLTGLIRAEVYRISGLLDGFRVLAEDRAPEKTPVNIHQILNHVNRLAATGVAAGLRLTEEYDPSLPFLSGNRDLLIQLFLNLVKNAAEAVGEGGAITLKTACRYGERFTSPQKGEQRLPLCVTVADNGPGIPPSIQQTLFEPFISGKAGGHGLGLALAAKIVHDHDGTITFESQPGKTAFHIRFPVMKDT